MSNGAAIYFHHRFDQPVAVVGALAFLYGISALYARALGGYLSDVLFEALSLRGRLLAQFGCMLVQGLLNVVFARMDTLGASVGTMVLFSVLVQASTRGEVLVWNGMDRIIYVLHQSSLGMFSLCPC